MQDCMGKEQHQAHEILRNHRREHMVARDLGTRDTERTR